jgi:hypothetical protein
MTSSAAAQAGHRQKCAELIIAKLSVHSLYNRDRCLAWTERNVDPEAKGHEREALAGLLAQEQIREDDGWLSLGGSEEDRNIRRLATLTELIVGDYRHYKGSLYTVVGRFAHSETGDSFVAYIPRYADGMPTIRPYEMFVSPVFFQVRLVHRFKYDGPSAIG